VAAYSPTAIFSLRIHMLVENRMRYISTKEPFLSHGAL
jgi:hypothetical protein